MKIEPQRIFDAGMHKRKRQQLTRMCELRLTPGFQVHVSVPFSRFRCKST